MDTCNAPPFLHSSLSPIIQWRSSWLVTNPQIFLAVSCCESIWLPVTSSAPPLLHSTDLPKLPCKISKMETLPSPFPLKSSSPKTKVFLVFFSMVLCTVALFILQLKFFKPRLKDFYSYEVKDSKGRPVALSKYRGKVSTSQEPACFHWAAEQTERRSCSAKDFRLQALWDRYISLK